MCSRYEAPDAIQLMKAFGVGPEHEMQRELWPGYTGPFLRAPQASDPDDEAAPSVEALTGVFGLLPFWAKDTKLARRTYNARSETADSKPSFRSAWRQAQHCIIPATAIYEPDWRSGKAVPTRMECPRFLDTSKPHAKAISKASGLKPPRWLWRRFRL